MFENRSFLADANNCCEEHDNCYIYHSQEFCDKKFCDCLNSMAEGDENCQDVSDFFCFAVGLFGSSAWQAANENASVTTTTTTTEVTVKVTTTTTTQPLEKIPSVGNATQPPHIGHLDIHLYCFEHGKLLMKFGQLYKNKFSHIVQSYTEIEIVIYIWYPNVRNLEFE